MEVRRYDDLLPDTEHEIDGFAFRTMPEPGELLATFATVNDVHFGETTCGVVSGHPEVGPVFRSAPGEDPYPETMNRGAVHEMEALDPAVVLVKGDLTSDGTDEEYAAFLAMYEPVFGDRLRHVRGNHDAYRGQDFAASSAQEITLPGVRLALLDTTVPRLASGSSRPTSSTGSTPSPPPAIDRSSFSATTTCGTRHRRSDPSPTSVSTPTRPRPSSRSWPGAARSSGTSPVTPIATACAASPPPTTCPGSR
ncbi:MAG: metallophosphoesterase [Acidimicrobiales bacterium]